MKFCRHLEENNQNYLDHLKDAWSFAAKSAAASAMLFMHGLLPFTFEHAGSDCIEKVYTCMMKKKRALTPPPPASESTMSALDDI
jgi:hypothetical protein